MENFKDISPLALAFIGDAIHTAFVRKQVLKGEKDKLNTYNNKAKKYCNAGAQAKALDRMQSILNEEENDIVRKTRNTHNKHSSKNFDEKTYNKATSFEALIGYLYLNERFQRLQELLQISMEEEI